MGFHDLSGASKIRILEIEVVTDERVVPVTHRISMSKDYSRFRFTEEVDISAGCAEVFRIQFVEFIHLDVQQAEVHAPYTPRQFAARKDIKGLASWGQTDPAGNGRELVIDRSWRTRIWLRPAGKNLVSLRKTKEIA